MARTPAQAQALEKKALASESKSAGMRMLLEAGYSVLEVRGIFDVAYGFVYGVAKRASFITATPRTPKAEVAKTKLAAKPAAKAKTATKPAATKPAAKLAAKAGAKSAPAKPAAKKA